MAVISFCICITAADTKCDRERFPFVFTFLFYSHHTQIVQSKGVFFEPGTPSNGYIFTRTSYHCYGLQPESNPLKVYPKNILSLYYLPGNVLINMHLKSCAPPTGSMNFQVMSPLKKNDTMSNYLKGTLVLFLHFVFYKLCRCFIHYFADPLAIWSSDPTLRTTGLDREKNPFRFLSL